MELADSGPFRAGQVGLRLVSLRLPSAIVMRLVRGVFKMI